MLKNKFWAFLLAIIAQYFFDKLPVFGITVKIYLLFYFFSIPKYKDIYFLLLTFLLAFFCDILENSGAVNAIATLSVAVLKIPLAKFLSRSYHTDLRHYYFSNMKISVRVLYVFLIVLFHQVIYYHLFYWGTPVSVFFYILKGTFFTGLIVFLYGLFFVKKAKR